MNVCYFFQEEMMNEIWKIQIIILKNFLTINNIMKWILNCICFCETNSSELAIFVR